MTNPQSPTVREIWATFGERTAIAFAETTTSYATLAGMTKQALEVFQKSGIRPGDIVLLEGDYHGPGVAALFALMELQAVILPVSPASQPERELREQTIPPQWLVVANPENPKDWYISQCERTDGEKAAELLTVLRERGHAGLILFSSGTTGRPKAMLQDLQELWQVHRERRAKEVRIYALLLFDHIGGLNTLLHTLAVGGTLVASASREPEEVAKCLERHAVRVLPASPSFLNLFLFSGAAEGRDLTALRMITYGTEPMPAALLERLRRQFPRVRLVQTFGTSETGIAQTTSPSADSLFFKIEDERTEWKIVDGELWLRSRTQILGYLNASMERFTEDGWFRTGDLVESRDDGTIQIIGRTSGMINVGGRKVHPVEVEGILLEHPLVRECQVCGEPHPLLGEVVTAVLEALPGPTETELRSQLRAHCRARLEAHKVPVKFRFVEKLSIGPRLKKGPAR